MTKKEEDVDRKMAAEYRDVTVETASENLLCYMTNSRELIAREVLRLDIDFQGENLARFIRPLPDSMKALIDKMEELHCRYSITGYPFLQGDEGFMVLQKEGKVSWYVPLKFLKNQKKYALVSRRNIETLYPDLKVVRVILGYEKDDYGSDRNKRPFALLELDDEKDEEKKQAYIKRYEEGYKWGLDRRSFLGKAFEKKDSLAMGLLDELTRKKKMLEQLRESRRISYFISLAFTDELKTYCYKKNPSKKNSQLSLCKMDYVIEKYLITKIEGGFLDCLNRYRTESGISESDLCQKAGISRQEYYKISNGMSVPDRETIVSFAFVLGLGVKDLETLLASAGYSFLPNDAYSRLVRKLICQGKTLDELNANLYEAGLLPDGGRHE